MITSREEMSAASRTGSDSLSSRENMVGTTCERVTRYRPTRSRNWAASKCSMTTTVAPWSKASATLPHGALWYSGAGDR